VLGALHWHGSNENRQKEIAHAPDEWLRELVSCLSVVTSVVLAAFQEVLQAYFFSKLKKAYVIPLTIKRKTVIQSKVGSY
jgi:hypothetical protein